MIAITGQVYQEFIGKAAFQETDFFGMTLPIVKHSYLVLTAEDLPKIVKEAFYLAESGRPGPVVIDIPKDVQQKVFEPFFPNEVAEMEGYKLDQPKATDDELIEVLNLISKAKNLFFIQVVESFPLKPMKNSRNLRNLPAFQLPIP